jgi:hypothetical protein
VSPSRDELGMWPQSSRGWGCRSMSASDGRTGPTDNSPPRTVITRAGFTASVLHVDQTAGTEVVEVSTSRTNLRNAPQSVARRRDEVGRAGHGTGSRLDFKVAARNSLPLVSTQCHGSAQGEVLLTSSVVKRQSEPLRKEPSVSAGKGAPYCR